MGWWVAWNTAPVAAAFASCLRNCSSWTDAAGSRGPQKSVRVVGLWRSSRGSGGSGGGCGSRPWGRTTLEASAASPSSSQPAGTVAPRGRQDSGAAGGAASFQDGAEAFGDGPSGQRAFWCWAGAGSDTGRVT